MPPRSSAPHAHPPWLRRIRPPSVLCVCLALASASTDAAECPAPLAAARALVVVTAQGMSARQARLRVFPRPTPSGPWHAAGPAEPAVIGAAGLGWGDPYRALAHAGEPAKAEGDRRTPAGLYRIGRSFGAAPHRRPGHLVLRPGEAICVDDPSSPAYNTIATGKAPDTGTVPRGEDMGAEPLYRRGLVVDYPSDAGRRAGSCIFIHVWRGPGRGTAGCVALPEGRLPALQDLATPAAIAILPEGAAGRFPGCLPATAGD